ncbi:hypothetical protein GJ633_04410 [Halorubrum sp. CBA1125]|uniref:hypothetical protein n=1 Tax=Halorubrum sp. CBA1125 TaxID=2668072 RepID=UPI00135E0A4B|nr:hypothetical protein [Halorubrum sp. CBA1125]MUW13991.1 hypothetical protein [Halorubrum sp. CBA1125]
MAVYAALFVLVAGAAGVLTVTADSPEVTFENPDYELSSDDTFAVDGQEYVLADVSESGGGGGGEATITGTLEREYTAELSESWSNGSTVTVEDQDWRVEIDGENATAFTLVEVIDRQAILEEDDAADNQTIERDDGDYVAVTEDGETTLVPADEYFPTPDDRSYETGDSFEYDNQTVTVDEITAGQAVLVWEGTQTETIEVEEGATVTLADSEFVAHFPDASTLQLSSDMAAYQTQLAQIDRFDRYNDGLTRVIALSLLSTVLLLAAAFVPSRY